MGNRGYLWDQRNSHRDPIHEIEWVFVWYKLWNRSRFLCSREMRNRPGTRLAFRISTWGTDVWWKNLQFHGMPDFVVGQEEFCSISSIRCPAVGNTHINSWLGRIATIKELKYYVSPKSIRDSITTCDNRVSTSFFDDSEVLNLHMYRWGVVSHINCHSLVGKNLHGFP